MNKIVVRLIVLLTVLGLVGFVAMNIQEVERLENIGPTAEASRNPYFAAERFLEMRGLQVSDELHRIDPSVLRDHDVLLLTDVSFLEGDKRRAQALLDWVARGGRLIFRLGAANGDNPLAFLMGISLSDVSAQPQQTDDQTDQTDQTDQLTPSQQVRPHLDAFERDIGLDQTSALVEEGQPPLRGYFHAYRSLQYDPQLAEYSLQPLGYAKKDNRMTLFRFQLGYGQVSVLTDISIWQNNYIGLFDHALLLAMLSQGADTFYLQHGVDVPTLLELILEHALVPAGLLLLLVLCWGIGQARQFGPLVVSYREQRRSLAEHVNAVGHFHRQHQQYSHLLEPLRRQVMVRARRYNPQFEQLSAHDQRALIEALTECEGEPVARALHRDGAYSQHEFLEAVQLLTYIRDQL